VTSAEKLLMLDRCARAAHLAKTWRKGIIHPTAALYAAIEQGLAYQGPEDCGSYAGDTLMTLAVERGLDTDQSDLFGLSQHLASLADFVVWMLRADGEPWYRPEDIKVGGERWESSVFLNKLGTRLRRVILVDRWSLERELAESHDWRTFGETNAYQMPLDQTVLVIGQSRSGRRHGPFTKGWLHPIAKNLRMRKRNGKGFDGAWLPVFREEWEGSREQWLDTMTQDGLLEDCIFHATVEVHEQVKQIRDLAERKLVQIRETVSIPPPSPSQCDDPLSPCEYRDACWSFQAPSVELGFRRAF
jgi:hypothetical protein